MASTDGSKMFRIIARSMRSAVPLEQSGRAHVLDPGSIGSGNPPTSLTHRSEVSVVVDEGTLLDLAGNSACRRALDLGRYTRAISVPKGGDQRDEGHPTNEGGALPLDRQNLFNFQAKDASKPEGRGTVSTMWSVSRKV